MENNFKENLKDLRIEKRIGQVELAEKLGVSKGTISLWENGLREPKLSSIVLLANFDKVEFPELWEQDMAAATENILLECVHLDMSGTWLGISPVAERMENVCKIFSLPENIVPFAITAIGYPLQKTSMDRDFDFSIVHYNEFKKA